MYLATAKISQMLDINENWLREQRGIIFKEGIHFHYPDGFNDTRWNIAGMQAWMENKDSSNTEADEVLKTLCA